MNKFDLIKMAFKNLFRRKSRTFLTALGIVIGTISIVVTVSLGLAMKKSFQDQMKGAGSMNIIQVSPGYDERRMRRSGQNMEEPVITEADIEKIKAIQGVDALTPVEEDSVKIISGKYIADVRIKAVEPGFMKEFGEEAEKGRILQEEDKVGLVFGSEIPYEFRDKQSKNEDMMSFRRGRRRDKEGERPDPKVNVLEDRLMLTFDRQYGVKKRPGTGSEKKVNVRPEKIACIGILKEGSYQSARTVYMPLNYFKKLKGHYIEKTETEEERRERRKKRNKGYSEILVKVSDINKIKGVVEEIRKTGADAWSNGQWVKEAEKQISIIQMIFGGIGGISLLVAAIGITNTMIMAIYERRKEIGVMKVIGASIRDIKRLFLLEAAFLGLWGGVFGLGFSVGISKLINYIAHANMQDIPPDMSISYVPAWLMFSALGFTALIGLISGYLPARKAMKLSALEAIKTE